MQHCLVEAEIFQTFHPDEEQANTNEVLKALLCRHQVIECEELLTGVRFKFVAQDNITVQHYTAGSINDLKSQELLVAVNDYGNDGHKMIMMCSKQDFNAPCEFTVSAQFCLSAAQKQREAA